MSNLDSLATRGLLAVKVGDHIFVSPKELITECDRDFIRLHRLELLAELSANDGIERRMHWSVSVNGKPVSVISGGPMTRDEALKSAIFHWPDAKIEP